LAVKYRNTRRFLTLFAACVVSLSAGAYLSYEAASLQGEGAGQAVVLASLSAPTPEPASAAQAVDPEPVASIAAPAAARAAQAETEAPKPTKISLRPSDQDSQLVLAYADAKLDPRASLPADAAPQEAAPARAEPQAAAAPQPSAAAAPQPSAAAKTVEAPQPPVPLPPVAPASLTSKSAPLPPRRPASLVAAIAPPAPVPSPVVAQPVPAAAPQADAPQQPQAAAAPAAPVPAVAPAVPVAPASLAAVTPKAPAPATTAAQVPVPAPARVEARLEAPASANPLPGITNALAAVSASVGGANAAPPQEAAPIPVPEITGGFKMGQQVYIRIFKQEGSLELWMKRGDRYALYKTFAVCKWSGALGPKTKQADYQSPEGFYSVSARQLNPHSHYHLAFDVGYPNAYDRRQGYTGSLVMVHGDCRSVGCFAMTDAGIDEIYPIVAAALGAGQREVPVHIFPFRMTEQAIARESSGPNTFLAFLDTGGAPKRDWSAFWHNLKQGYDLFERSRVPPVAYACGDRYEFGGAGAACARIAGW
jgi:murein L,D-transpeptidase YafK